MSEVVNHNIFAALGAKKKKKSNKSSDAHAERKHLEHKTAEIEKAIFSAPAAGVSNWADESDEEWAATAMPTRGDEGWNQVRELNRGFSFAILIPESLICRIVRDLII
jgi:hypothetical protein